MFSLIFFILFLLKFKVEAGNSCNDECLSKTYCLTSDGSDICSNNNLVTAQFKVVPVFGEYDHLQLTLKGYNVAVGDEKTIKVSLNQAIERANVYSCYKSSLGSTSAMFDRGTHILTTGSSNYSEGVLSCTWILTRDDDIWPAYNSFHYDMFRYKSQFITLYNDSQSLKVAEDTSQVPIYHAQYLKCCNRVHGNDKFQLTFDQVDKKIHYQLYYLKEDKCSIDVILTRKDGMKLQFTCFLDSESIMGSVANSTEEIFLHDQLIKPTVINYEICSWSTPYVVGDSKITIDASTSIFDLEVDASTHPIYIEKDVVLKNSANQISSWLLHSLLTKFINDN